MSSFFRDYFRKNSIAGPACYDERDSGSPDAGDPVEVDQGGRNRDLLQMRFVRMQGIIKEFRNRTRCQLVGMLVHAREMIELLINVGTGKLKLGDFGSRIESIRNGVLRLTLDYHSFAVVELE